MTRTTLTLAALAAFAAAAPAAAQYDARYGGYAAAGVDIGSLGAEIDAAVARGDISSRDAWSLRSQLRGLVNLQRQYARDGLSWSERNDLQQRALGLRNEIAAAGGYASTYDRNDDRYGNSQYGAYGNGYDRYGNAGTTYNSGTYGSGTYGNGTYGTRTYGNGTYGNSTYGTRTYGNGTYNNGTYDNGYANRGYGSSQYSQYDRDQADRTDGYADDETVQLRVGDRAPSGLYGVPDEYRARFRDGPTFYYRYGAGNIYQIDVRNGVVTRVIRVDR